MWYRKFDDFTDDIPPPTNVTSEKTDDVTENIRRYRGRQLRKSEINSEHLAHSKVVLSPAAGVSIHSDPKSRRYAALLGMGETMRAVVILVALILAMPSAASAGNFGEGYSSAKPGGPSAIHFRAFTIYTAQEACEKSRLPVILRILPNPLKMKIGDRIYRSNVNEHPSELVIEAYDENGTFLPAVPIIVSILDVQNVTRSRSDWDYFEAIREGESELVVRWACSAPGGPPVEGRAHILVMSGNAEAVNFTKNIVRRVVSN